MRQREGEEGVERLGEGVAPVPTRIKGHGFPGGLCVHNVHSMLHVAAGTVKKTSDNRNT